MKAIFNAVKLLYFVLAIPISNDPSFIKKSLTFIEINLKVNYSQTNFSEKFDHLALCKKLNFFCFLYLSLKKHKNLTTISVLNSEINNFEIYSSNLTNEYRENFIDFFTTNLEVFFNNLYLMIVDCYVVLTLDKKTAKNYKNYQFISGGNRISIPIINYFNIPKFI